jgi:hypothetical protein
MPRSYTHALSKLVTMLARWVSLVATASAGGLPCPILPSASCTAARTSAEHM